MHKGDKAPEPTMEEILASIRKIIAEEPIGSRPGPVPGSAGVDEPGALPMRGSTGSSRANDPVLPLPSRNDADSDGPAYSVEEALSELMDDRPQRQQAPLGRDEPALKPQARPTPAAEDDNRRPSWLFGSQTGSPASQGSSSTGSGPARASGLLSQLEGTRQGADRGAGDTGAAAPKAPAALKASDTGPASERPRDTGRSGLADFFSSAQAQSNEIPKPSAQRIPARDGRSDQIAQPPVSATPTAAARPGPAAAQGRPFESLLGSGLQSASARQDATGQASSADLRRQASLAQPEPAKETKVADTPATDVGRPKEAAPQAATPASGAGVSNPEKSEAREAGKGDSISLGASSSNSGPRTLEDTVAELLRPMLREWLDSNLPRIVEKAIRVEMAARAKPQDADEGPRS